jgi:hypothetical protein
MARSTPRKKPLNISALFNIMSLQLGTGSNSNRKRDHNRATALAHGLTTTTHAA